MDSHRGSGGRLPGRRAPRKRMARDGGKHCREFRSSLVEKGPVVVLATSVTTTTRMLPVLAHATMTSGHVPALLPVLPEP